MAIGKTNALTIGSGGSTAVLREYTSSETWTKPTGIKYAIVICIGAGGGGGSGRRGAASSLRCGGSAASGGYIVRRLIEASVLPSSVSIVVGAGGNGGAAQTVNDSNGNNGTYGGNTSFGTLVRANCSGVGLGGRNTAGWASGGQSPSSNCVPSLPFYIIPYTDSPGMTQQTPLANGLKPFSHIYLGTPGGMPGAGITAANVVGSMISLPNMIKADGTEATGTAAEANGADNVCLQLLNQYGSVSITKGVGAGGGGGNAGDIAGTVAGKAGGNGGNYGAGGGGGGASTNGANSGKGGDGAGGLCIILEIY